MTLNAILARLVGQIFGVVEGSLFGGGIAGSVAEIGIFVHVEPNSTELYFLVQSVEHILPILGGIRVEEINKSS